MRQSPDQRRNGDDLVAARQLRMLQQVDHFDLYRPARCSSQIASRFRSAAVARALRPAMYSLRIHSFLRRRLGRAAFLAINVSGFA